MRSWLSHKLDRLRARGLHRTVRRVDSMPGPRVWREGRELLLFASNDYLGLAEHPRVVRAAQDAAARFGAGAAASRLISGHLALHEELEADLAAFHRSEAAMVFSSGYAANVGCITSLVGATDAVYLDALDHASIFDAARLSGAAVHVYRHRDVEHLAALLEAGAGARHRLIVTDGVFSMDGDLAPLPELVAVARRFDAWLMVDDAHGLGVLGPGGAGTASHFGMGDGVHVHVGTLSKALGSQGGYVAGDRDLIDYLRNRARSFMFSTGLAPACTGAARESLRVLAEEPARVEALRGHAGSMRQRLQRAGLDVPDGPTPILPIPCGEADRAMALAREAEARGVLVVAIRPPAVPHRTCRVRVTVMATHGEDDLDRAARALADAAIASGVLAGEREDFGRRNGEANVNGAAILGTGMNVPAEVLHSATVERRLGLPPGWIERRTGVRERRIVEPHEAVSDLAYRAAARCLVDARIDPETIGLTILATSTPDHPLPPTAPAVRHRLGVGGGAYDLAGACCGFVAALSAARDAVYMGTYDAVLVIGANVLSRRVDWGDAATASLFGDGAGAVVVGSEIRTSRRPVATIVGTRLDADGSDPEAVWIPAGGSRQPLDPALLDEGAHLMRMPHGSALFRKAVELASQTSSRLLTEHDVPLSMVDWLLPHQANGRLVSALASRLGVAPDRVLHNYERYGNTSSATIPILLHESRRADRFTAGDTLLLAAVGSGLTSAAALLRWREDESGA